MDNTGTITVLTCVVLMTVPTILLSIWCVGLLSIKAAQWGVERLIYRLHRNDGLQTSRF